MLTLASKIDAVQVYRRGATVFRTAQLSLDGPLPEEIELVDLPLTLLDPTVRVRVTATEPSAADVVAAGVRVGLWVRPGDPPPKAPEQAELEEVRRRLRRAREEHEQLEAEIGLLSSVEVPERPYGEEGKAPPASPMAARLQLEQFVDDATGQRLGERRTLRERIRTLEEEEQRLEERITAASSAAEVHLEELRKSVVIRLRARGAAGEGVAPRSLTLELSYVVPGARWAPAYQCKLARDGSRAEIQLRAYIAQRTGEDWKGVRLRLSTALPLSFTELPELSSVKIGRAQPGPAKKGFRPPPQGGEVLFRDYDRDLAETRSLVPSGGRFVLPALSGGPPPTDELTRSRPARKRAARRDEDLSRGAAESVDDIVLGVAAEPEMAEMEMVFEDADDSEVTPHPAAPSPPPSARMAELSRAESRVAARSASAPPAPSRAAPLGAAGGAAAYGAQKRKGEAVAPDDVLEAVVYPLLRLPTPADPGGRGRLVAVDVRELYRESVARFGRPVRFDLSSAVRHAEEVARSVASMPLPDGTVDAHDISSHFDFAYEADGLVEVIADGTFHSVALGDRASEARMRYIAVPREELAVYRVAALTNPVPAPLLPGPAEVYVGGEYVLTTRLPTVPARGELKLGLGVEQSIKIARNARFQELRSGEKVVAMSELVHDLDVDVVNHLERDIEIEVRERVPVPAPGAEVVVEEGQVEPAWEPYDQEERGQPIEGGRRWTLQVQKGSARKLSARYVVKIYANNEIAGGNRREA
jgi:hypothetical protein